MKVRLFILCVLFAAALRLLVVEAKAAPPENSAKSKFYNFEEQIIDGEIRKPTALYIDHRGKVKFERLLRLKKSFMNDLFDTAKERVFR